MGVGVGVEVGVTAAAGELAVGVTVGVAVAAAESTALKDKRPRDEEAIDQSSGTSPGSKSAALSNGKRVKVTTGEPGTGNSPALMVHRIEEISDDDVEEPPHAPLLAASAALSAAPAAFVGGSAAGALGGGERGGSSGSSQGSATAPTMTSERLAAELTWCILWAIPCASHAATNAILQANPRTAEVVAMLEALMRNFESGTSGAGALADRPARTPPTQQELNQIRGFLTMLT